jgi:hypothetical protein
MPSRIVQEIRGILTRRKVRKTEQATALERIIETNAVFVHVPKCGGKSIVRDVYGLSEHEWFGHAGIGFYHSLLGPRRFRKAFKFGFVRDPMTRCLSGFKFRQRGGFGLHNDKAMASKLAGLSFEQFVLNGKLAEFSREDIVFKPQMPLLVLWDGQLGVDRVCFFENFDEEVRSLPLQLHNGTPSHINASPRDPESVMSLEVHNRIADIYAQDYRFITSLKRAHIDPLA